MGDKRMKVDDAIKVLGRISRKGGGSLPLQLMIVEDGLTFAEDIKIEKAEKYDGSRIWIYGTDRHNPEWMK
jgi:hypothetical protein